MKKNLLAGIIYSVLFVFFGSAALTIFIFSSGSENIYDLLSNLLFVASMVLAGGSVGCCFMAFKAFDKGFKKLKRRARSRY